MAATLLPLLPHLPEPEPKPADADFLRHRRALATQLTETSPDLLRPILTSGNATISHW